MSFILSNMSRIFTTTVTGAKFIIPDGAIEIFMNNIGAGNATWTGNTKSGDDASAPVILKPNATFAYGYIGRGRIGFEIDATLTTVEISITT